MKAIEKNWVYFEHCGDLYLIYSFSPYRLLRLTNPEKLCFSTVFNESFGQKLADLGDFKTMVSLSTNPIDYDDRHWLLMVHQIKRTTAERYYYHWAVLIDKDTLLPSRITSEPVLTGTGARGRRPGILYIASAIAQGADFVLFSGEGDAYATRCSVARSTLEKKWRDI